MPTNGLAPPDMPWLFTRPGQPNGLGPPLLNYAAPPDAGGQTLGSAVADTGANAWQWLQDQRAESVRQGLLDPETGLPTQKGLVDAARATAEGVMMGTTAPGDVPKPNLSLERVNSARQWMQPNNHSFAIKDHTGEDVGTIDTEWDPQMAELHILEIQSAKGANTIGPAAIRQLRDALLEHYPEARTLSGYRTTGAGPDRETFQRLQRYQGRDE